MNSRARSSCMLGRSGAVEASPALYLVLVHDGGRVGRGQPVLIGEPGGALGAPHEGRSRFQAVEPLSEVTAGDPWDASDQVLVHLRRVDQGQGAPPGLTNLPQSSLPYAGRPGKT